MQSSQSFEMPASSEHGCLNTPVRFSFGGELSFSFSFSRGFFSSKFGGVFIALWRITCSLRFRNAKPYFCIEKLQETGQCPCGQSQKRKTNLRNVFPAKKYQSERGRLDKCTFWKRWRQIFSKMEITKKILRKWTLYFWIGTPWLREMGKMPVARKGALSTWR